MQQSEQTVKDPSIGAVLSLFFPGLGHLYAGNGRGFVGFFLLELFLYNADVWVALIPVHIFQSVAAAGAVTMWNKERAAAAAADVDIPPPPRAGTNRAAARECAAAEPTPVPPPPPPPAPAAVLGPDEFLDELQASWREYRASSITARQFADRKWRAIRAVRVDDRDDGEALVAAARELGGAGVLTSEEIGQLETRVTP
jgi:hypothetical protein